MKKFISKYVSDLEKELNIPLLNKEADRPLVEYIMDAWKSLSILKNIEIVDFKFTEHESEIDINKHIFKRDKKKKKKERVEYKFINDDRLGKLTVWVKITVVEKDLTTGKPIIHEKTIKKEMLIPLMDENGYLYLKGKKYYMIYQMVEKSTYTSSQAVTLKSLMPISVKRNAEQYSDVDGKSYTLPVYYIFIFRKEVPVLLFYAAHGMSWLLHYLKISTAVKFVSTIENRKPEYLYFPISSKCFLEVPELVFNKYPFIQSVIGGILSISTNRLNVDQLNDESIWIKKIGNNNYDKGKDTLRFFNRLLDETTKKILKVDEIHKQDIYSLLRWIMMNYNELRMKDNMDLNNKRLRCNEYISSLLTKEFSKRLNRIISLGDKATMDDYKDLFSFPGDILMLKMHSSGILRFDDCVNDMDMWSKCKYTTKGRTKCVAPKYSNVLEKLL